MSARHRSSRRPATSSSPLPAWGVACFFASGAAGLLYEVVWSKQLSYLLGNSLHAVATVAAAFLAGLALGACFLGPALQAKGDGARVYARLELAVAGLGLLWLPLLRGLDPLVGVLYRACGGEGPLFALARLALLFTLLVPPAMMMGATLPLLVGRFERDRLGPALARLCAVNTLGAVAGTLAGGFLLLPVIGLAWTTGVAAALNLVAAAVAWRAAPAAPETRAAVEEKAEAIGTALAGRVRFAFVVLFMLSGCAALALQIAWVRLFTLMFGSSVYSFSAVLGIYLLGWALGSAAIGPWLRGRATLAGFGLLQLALAVSVVLQLIALPKLPEWTYALVERSGASFGWLLAGEAALLAAFLIPPCALLGAAFPLAARLLQRGDAAHAAGLAYAVNTLGTIAGALLAGFVAIPTLGVQVTFVLVLCLAAAIGVAAFALGASRREVSGRDLTMASATFAAIAALAFLAPRWQPALMSVGAFRPVQARHLARVAERADAAGSIVRRAASTERVLYYGEGLNGSVLVGTDEAGAQRWLRVGGKIDASTGRDMETQVLLGLIPAACADSGARTLVIGLGSGVTVAAALAAGAGPTEVVELERHVVSASRFFHAAGEHPLDDPRVRLVVGDARTHLAHGGGRYGLIVSEPSNPWIAGVNNLFTVDFYRRARASLEPDGVFCQWLQLYELSPGTLASLLASFLEVFPEGHAYTGCRGDLLLVAAPPDARIALERLRTQAARTVLARAGIASPEALAGHYAGPFSALRPLAAGGLLNRDDLPRVEYQAPRDLVTEGRSKTLPHWLAEGVLPVPTSRPAGPLFAAWSDQSWIESRARMLVDAGDLDGAASMAGAARQAGLSPLAGRLSEEIAASARRGRAVEHAEQARALMAAGHDAEALAVLKQALAIDSTDARLWLWNADRRRLAGDWSGAEADLARGRKLGDAAIQADAAVIAGMLAIDRSQPLVAAARFREVQRWNPGRADGYLFEACARAAGGDAAGAKQVLRRGLERLPGEADLGALLVSLERTP